MTSLFFCYSHKDETLRNELETHLSLLKRQGRISAWHDRRITAGRELDSAISSELEAAGIILLLVSANFLASDYCYDKEMTRALERNDAGTAIVIPIILHPCDWHSAPFGKLRATPNDDKPVSMFANIHEAFSIITKDIRDALDALPEVDDAEQLGDVDIPTAPATDRPTPRSSNLAIRKAFNDHERDQYLEDTYEYISRFFRGSLEELEKRNTQIQTRFKTIDGTNFIASVYANGKRAAACSIWFGSSLGGRGICYSNSDEARGNGFNEMISVTDDGYQLRLKPMGMQTFGRGREADLTQQGAAEHLWCILIRHLQ